MDPPESKLHVSEWSPSPFATQAIPCARKIPPHVDSGYVTRINTAFPSPVASDEDALRGNNSHPTLPREEFAHSNTRSVPLPGKPALHIFRRNIDYTSNARFREILPCMRQLLQKSLQRSSWVSVFQSAKTKSRQPPVTMSMRLMVVGATVDTAKPSIVIFLAGEQARHVEAALETTALRELYRPDDGVTPAFDVVVVGQEPATRSNWEVSVAWEASRERAKSLPTFCGVQICFDNNDGRAVTATVGGIVKVTYGPGDFKLVGMTAGHPLRDLLDPEYDGSCTPFTSPRSLGTVLHPLVDSEAGEHRVDVPKLDWALVNIDSPMRMRPNLLHIAGSEGGTALHEGSKLPRAPLYSNGHSMSAAPPESFPDINPIEVVLLGGSSRFSGAMLGLLSHMPGAIMLSPEDGFIDTYLLTLDEGQEVRDGDSGSWVVNPISWAVYGHVVATDMTGDAYVVPLHAALEEMKEVLGVESITLAGTADLLDAALLRGVRKNFVLDDTDSGYVSVASAISDAVAPEPEEAWANDDDVDSLGCW